MAKPAFECRSFGLTWSPMLPLQHHGSPPAQPRHVTKKRVSPASSSCLRTGPFTLKSLATLARILGKTALASGPWRPVFLSHPQFSPRLSSVRAELKQYFLRRPFLTRNFPTTPTKPGPVPIIFPPSVPYFSFPSIYHI